MTRVTLGLALAASLGHTAMPVDYERLKEGFRRPPADARIMMRWWWFGPAVTKTEIEREMRRMKEGGIGGFEVQPVYPLALNNRARGVRNLAFLSDEFLDALRFTAAKARELGLRMDLTLGSGWPFGGPHIPASLAAGKLRCERVQVPPGARDFPLPAISEGEKLIATFLDGTEVPGPDRLPTGDGKPRVALFFISSRTGMMVKRAAVGAEGFVLDHYNREALERHLAQVGDPLLRAFGGRPPYAVFCDSLEVFGSDWTPDFLDEFRRRRGYDLKPLLPAMAENPGEDTAAIRHDWGLTLGELADERFLRPLREWAASRGTRLRCQTYGTPPVSLASNGLVDLAEGEGSHWDRFTSSRWASSAGHHFGKNEISSETWTWLHSPALRATPLDMKAEADRHFLQGVNQLIGHGWPYSPEAAGQPGWRFYAAAMFNQHNPWWIVMPDITAYLQRVSFLLRQGKPASDVAVYLPSSDARASFQPGDVSVNRALERMLGPSLVARILGAGFAFDFIDDGVIREHGRAETAALAVNGNRYRAVVLPNVERIPIETYRKLETFVNAGGMLVATRRAPSLAPGLLDGRSHNAEVRAISRRLFDGPRAPAHLVADEDGRLAAKLASLMQPDVALSPAAPEIGFIRRSVGFAEIYFLANTGNTRRRVDAIFRGAGMEPEWWDPFTGAAEPAGVKTRAKGRLILTLELGPYESRVLVFSRREPAPRRQSPAPALPPPVDLSTGWNLRFDALGRTVRLNKLRSWTEDPETRFYSGTATYERAFAMPEIYPGVEYFLDFGEGTPIPERAQRQPGMRAWLDAPVREAAVVYVNGAVAGSVWRPPYRLEVTALLRPGENALRVVAGNLAINGLAGSPPPDYTALHRRYGKRFDPQDMEDLQPLPAGLLGPVRLVSAAKPGIFSSKKNSASPARVPESKSGARGGAAARSLKPRAEKE